MRTNTENKNKTGNSTVAKLPPFLDFSSSSKFTWKTCYKYYKNVIKYHPIPYIPKDNSTSEYI